MTNDELYAKALEYWGIIAQFDMLTEECAELIQAVQKVKRHGTSRMHELIDELADVSIMIEQIKLYAGRDKVDARIKAKLDRLKAKLYGDAT